MPPTIDMKVDDIVAALRTAPIPIGKPSPLDGPGLYAIYLKSGMAIPQLELNADGLLYVGMTDVDFHERNHFTKTSSHGSSPRRSLGALLKTELQLSARHRGRGTKRIDFLNYGFDDGESRLTAWMDSSLLIARCGIARPVEAGRAFIEAAETSAIKSMQPPLCLKKWDNPQKALVEGLRATCVAEAESRHMQMLV